MKIMSKYFIFFLFYFCSLTHVRGQKYLEMDSLIRAMSSDTSEFIISSKVKSIPRYIRRHMKNSNYDIKLGGKNSELSWGAKNIKNIFKKKYRIVQSMKNKNFCIILFESAMSKGGILYSLVYNIESNDNFSGVKMFAVYIVKDKRQHLTKRELLKLFLESLRNENYSYQPEYR